jgi:hypothetical protein
MKYSNLMRERRGATTIEEAEQVVGGRGMLEMLRKSKWLAPKVQGNRLTLFDYDECLGAWRRVCEEGIDALRVAAQIHGQSPNR